MLDKDSSLRINLLRFPLIVGVVFIHAYGTTVGFSGGVIGINKVNFVAEFVRNLVSQGLARVAVPLFFLMSGYLFFHGFNWSKESYLLKLKSRVRTLLIPFLFWNIATLILFAALQAIPATHTYFSGRFAPIASYSGFDFLNAVFGINKFPIAYQFWFIRDLMLLVLFGVPLISIMNKVAPRLFLCILLICWFMNKWPASAPSSEALLFFAVGVYLATIGRDLFSLDRFGAIVVALYLPLVVLDSLTINESFNPYLHRVGIVAGVVAALCLTKVIASSGLKPLILWLSNVSFFLFAIHATLLTTLEKIAYRIIAPHTSFTVLSLYFAVPITTICSAVLIYRGLLFLRQDLPTS